MIKTNLSEEEKDFIRNKFATLTNQGRKDFFSSLTPQAFQSFIYSDLILRNDQLIPKGDWRYCVLLTGRGWGKTTASSQWIADKVKEGSERIAIVAPTYSDLILTMIPAIQERFPPKDRPIYLEKKSILKFPSGQSVHCFTLETERSRGGNYEYCWIDEIVKSCDGLPDKIEERFNTLDFSVRIGKAQILISTTPKNFPFIVKWDERFKAGDPSIIIKRGSILDNIYLAEGAKQALISRYKDSRFGRQELFGDLITETDGAFWTHKQIDDLRQPLPSPPVARKAKAPLSNAQLMGLEPLPEAPPSDLPYLLRTGIGFDPSGSVDGDECGIIVVSLYSNQHAYVRLDSSGSYNPDDYAKLIDKLYKEYQASFVMVESNFGGKASFLYILRSVNATMNVKTIHSKQGKATRAEHISGLYSQGRVHHTGTFKQLEDQMCSFNVHYSKSPDRLDALSFVLSELFWPGANALNNPSFRNLPVGYR